MSRRYTISRLAAAAGVHIETIRFYQRLRLVSEPSRPLGGIPSTRSVQSSSDSPRDPEYRRTVSRDTNERGAI
jgi:hypothetical protein